MALYIRTNIASMGAQKNLARSQMALTESFNRLSSGYRINSAADDAAGLAISESMRTQIRSLTVAERNAQDAISMSQTAEGALGEIHGVLGRMRELAVQSGNGSLTGTDRGYLESEFDALQQELIRIQGSTRFNGKEVVSPTAEMVTFQVGLHDTTADQIMLTFGGVGLSTITDSAASLVGTTASNALAVLATIDGAMEIVSTARSRFGAAMNRMAVATSIIQTMRLNMSAANSRIRDVNVADETAALSKNQVLTQAGISVLSQANQLPQLALSLING